MSAPFFRLEDANHQIDTGETLDSRTVTMGKSLVTLEKVHTIWHTRGAPGDAVYRVSVDGIPFYSAWGGRAFINGFGLHGRSRPEWLPEGISVKRATAVVAETIKEMA